MKQTERWGG